MIAIRRAENTDLKCPSSTLQQVFWQVGTRNKTFRKSLPWNFPGLYGGVYLAQNYKVPLAPNPQTLYEKASSWLETIKKDGGKEDW